MHQPSYICAVVLCLALNLSWSQSSIVGLWEVTSVQAGEQIMTPRAKWMRFNTDLTQESGNGWKQHSYGTYHLDPETQQLSVDHINGLKDPFGPFTIESLDDNMIWSRMEGPDLIRVTLSRIQQLPQSQGDQVIGLWRMKDLMGSDPLFSPDESTEVLIHIRWDNKFMIGSSTGKIYGVYVTHAHKDEIELIPYGDQGRSFWTLSIDQETIELTLLNTDEDVKRSFYRIDEFPE